MNQIIVPAVIVPSSPWDTLPFKDWLWKNGIPDVMDEDWSVKQLTDRLDRLDRFGKRSKPEDIRRAFGKDLKFLCQQDCPRDSGFSSRVTLRTLRLNRKVVEYFSSNITVSEHAVRRYWEHTQVKPDVTTWCRPQVLTHETEYLATPQGLLCGQIYRGTRSREKFILYPRERLVEGGLTFGVKTIIPKDMLNSKQEWIMYNLLLDKPK
jgi:hypothetical protein